MINIVRSELTKAYTLPRVQVVTAALVLLFLAIQPGSSDTYREVAAGVDANQMVLDAGQLTDAATVLIGYVSASTLNAGLLLPILGAVIGGAEFRHGQLGLSVVAVPNRRRLVVGKVLATGLVASGISMLFSLISSVVAWFAIKDWNPGLLVSPNMLTAHARLLLFCLTITLISLGVTLVARRTLIGIIVSVVLIMLTMTQVVALVSPAVDALLPWSASRNLLLQDVFNGVPLTGSALHGGAVLTCWVMLIVIASVIIIQRRDAR
ncbi:MAG: hypothetical protein L0G99_07635 [Propionibacteriales bacterium]|nr:hypothetical protein [Propionibacteriales bacterium]